MMTVVSDKRREKDVWSLQKDERFTFATFHLIHRALARCFVRTPAKKLCAVPEPPAREMVVGNFHNCFGSDWFPFASAIGAPAAGSAGRIASKSRWFPERFEFPR